MVSFHYFREILYFASEVLGSQLLGSDVKPEHNTLITDYQQNITQEVGTFVIGHLFLTSKEGGSKRLIFKLGGIPEVVHIL